MDRLPRDDEVAARIKALEEIDAQAHELSEAFAELGVDHPYFFLACNMAGMALHSCQQLQQRVAWITHLVSPTPEVSCDVVTRAALDDLSGETLFQLVAGSLEDGESAEGVLRTISVGLTYRNELLNDFFVKRDDLLRKDGGLKVAYEELRDLMKGVLDALCVLGELHRRKWEERVL